MIAMGNGVATASNVGLNLPPPATWRVSVTVGGSTPAVTGRVDCNTRQ